MRHQSEFGSVFACVIGVFIMMSTSAHAGKYPHYSSYHYKNKQCYQFEMRTKGGLAGIRFMHNVGNFTSIKRGSYLGKVCGRDQVTVELSRKNPGTKVVLFIDGEKHIFGRHEPAHKYLKTWQRKYVRINFGEGRQHYSGTQIKKWRSARPQKPRYHKPFSGYVDSYGYGGHHYQPRRYRHRHGYSGHYHFHYYPAY